MTDTTDSPELLPCRRHWPLRHGHARHIRGSKASPTYQSWMAMKQRCGNPGRDPQKKYGARGIAFDPSWEEFSQFLSDMGERPEGTTLDRIDSNGDYGPGNCRWATPIQQGLGPETRGHPRG